MAAFAAPTCSIDPFSVKVSQGEAAQLSVVLQTENPEAPFEVSLGSLPDSVESGFLKKENMETIGDTKKIPLIVQTKQNAQIGSFMIAIIYKTSETEQNICQFNLEVKKKSANAISPTPLSEPTTKSIASGVLPTASNPIARVMFTRNFSMRSVGDEVKSLQETLRSLGFFPKGEEATGYFGKITEAAVKGFQKSRNIEMLGIVGPKTRKALNELSQ